MPANPSPAGALPARFRKARLLVVGCGDIGLRVAALVAPRLRVLALTSSPGRVVELRGRGVMPLLGDLDRPQTIRRLAGLSDRVLHLAPPGALGGDATDDKRTHALLAVLARRSPPWALVYGSTSGVYGDCAGRLVGETEPPHARTPRALRRLDAEARVRHFGRMAGVRTSVLRIPGIYALDRAGGTPADRLARGTPVLTAEDDVYTSHIHADDLARACVAALWRGRAQRIVNVNDDTRLKMGDYFDRAADLLGLPRPPRIARTRAQQELPATMLSFMRESRQLDNRRMKQELRLRLHYPTIEQGLQPLRAPTK